MEPVAVFLLAIAAIFLIGAVGEIFFQRTNIPDVIWLILAGILLGPVTDTVTREQLGTIAPYFAALTLVVVLFDGGSALRLSDLLLAARRSTALAILTFLLAMFAVAGFTMLAARIGILPSEWSWLHGFMTGCILGGSSSIIIMPAMSQARVEGQVANLVSLESALTDALCVVGTAALIDIIILGGASGPSPALTLLKSFGLGVGIAFAAGMVWILFLRFLHSSEHSYPVTLAALLVLYVIINGAGGSAALGILTFAVVLGNAEALGRYIGLVHRAELGVSVRGFHRQMTFMVKSFFFVFIGAMLGPPWSLILAGIVLGAVLLLARIPGVLAATAGSGLSGPQKKLVTVAMPRGMAAGVLATLPVTAGVPGTSNLPVMVFACVFTTIMIFAVGFPLLRGKRAPIRVTTIADDAPVIAVDAASVARAAVAVRATEYGPEPVGDDAPEGHG